MDALHVNVETVALDNLHQDPANARAHDDRNIQSIRDSLQEFGQVEPLIVHQETGKVIGGNGRLQAMRDMGWDEAQVVQLDVTELEATKLAIALNRTAELATWDEDVLAQELEALLNQDEDLGQLFTDDELIPLLDRDPGFRPGDEDSQGQLDELDPVTCPACGHQFHPNG